jgi:hypothetical protein
MFKTKIFQNQWRNDRNENLAKYIHDLEMHDSCLILRVITTKPLLMIEIKFFSAEGKAKLKKITKDQVLERTFQRKNKKIKN